MKNPFWNQSSPFISVIILSSGLLCVGEYCQGYFNPHIHSFTSTFHCAKYCCGTCYDRYCCDNITLSINNFDCQEKCVSYIDPSNKTQLEQKCDYGEVCCGTCEARLCCSKISKFLYQKRCSNNLTETTSYGLDGFIIFLIVLGSLGICIIATGLIVVCLIFINEIKRKCRNDRSTSSPVVIDPQQNVENEQILNVNSLHSRVNDQSQVQESITEVVPGLVQSEPIPESTQTSMSGEMEIPSPNLNDTPSDDLPPPYSENMKTDTNSELYVTHF